MPLPPASLSVCLSLPKRQRGEGVSGPARRGRCGSWRLRRWRDLPSGGRADLRGVSSQRSSGPLLKLLHLPGALVLPLGICPGAPGLRAAAALGWGPWCLGFALERRAPTHTTRRNSQAWKLLPAPTATKRSGIALRIVSGPRSLGARVIRRQLAGQQGRPPSLRRSPATRARSAAWAWTALPGRGPRRHLGPASCARSRQARGACTAGATPAASQPTRCGSGPARGDGLPERGTATPGRSLTGACR